MSTAPNAAEKKIITAAKTGEEVIFDEDKRPDIRAEVLRNLIVGLPQKERKTPDPVSARGIRVVNANIIGALDLADWPGRNDNPSPPLPGLYWLNCAFDAPVHMGQSHFAYLTLLRCEIVAIFAANARFDGAVELRGSTCAGAEHPLYGHQCALDLDNARVDGNLELSTVGGKRFTAQGEVRFLGAQIGGQLNASGAKLTNKGGYCLHFDRAVIKGDVFLRTGDKHRFEAVGCVRFLGAQIGGQVAAIGVSINHEDAAALMAYNCTIRGNVIVRPPKSEDYNFDTLSDELRHARPNITGKVDFRRAEIGGWVSRDCEFSGPLDLRFAHIGQLGDNPETGWPKERGQLKLDGLVYDALDVVKAEDVAQKDLASRRITWLKQQYKDPEKPTKDEFRPQPFTQLAKVLRAQGHGAEADRVAIELQILQMRTGGERRFMRFMQGILNLTSKFGYSSGRAVLALFVWLSLGTAMYGLHAFAGHFGPADKVHLGIHDTVARSQVVLVPPIAGLPAVLPKITRSCPGLVAPLYALDAMLPLVDFGQRRLCAFDPQGPWAPLWRLLHTLYALFGAILSAIAIFTLTGLMRKD